MIDNRPFDPNNIFDFYQNRVMSLRAISDVHRGWRTHRFTSGCWICQLLETCESLLGELENYINTKSPQSSMADDANHIEIVERNSAEHVGESDF